MVWNLKHYRFKYPGFESYTELYTHEGAGGSENLGILQDAEFWRRIYNGGSKLTQLRVKVNTINPRCNMQFRTNRGRCFNPVCVYM